MYVYKLHCEDITYKMLRVVCHPCHPSIEETKWSCSKVPLRHVGTQRMAQLALGKPQREGYSLAFKWSVAECVGGLLFQSQFCRFNVDSTVNFVDNTDRRNWFCDDMT